MCQQALLNRLEPIFEPFTFLKVVKNPLKEGMVDAESLLQSLVTPAVPNKKHSVLPETTTVA